MKISEPAASVRISDLPTPRLRARATELAILSQTIPPDGNAGDLPLDGAFDWSKTTEWMMGWPSGWTDLKPLEMDKYQSWLQQHGSNL